MDLSSIISQNQFLSGGLLLMFLGGAVMLLRRLPGKIYDFIERFFIIKIEILDEDEAYGWMQIWLAERLKKTLSISVVTKRPLTPDEDGESGFKENKPHIYFVPAVGTYFFWYRGRFVVLHRDRKENSAGGGTMGAIGGVSSMMRAKESFTMRIISRKKDLAMQLLEECREMAIPDDGKLDIRIATYSYWSLGTRVRPRSLDSVILDGNQAEDLLADVREFLSSYEWYTSVGVPYRRNYLLYGPPGSGKSSSVKALAGELGMHIYLLMLSDPDMTDNRVNDLLAKVADRNILLLEDIDCAFGSEDPRNEREKRKGKNGGGLTFSGLLNTIDGVASPEGRIIFMTTNHIDRLDPAMIRPGRADVKLYFGNATAGQAGRLFERFFPDHRHLARDFSLLIPEHQYSMATLQDYLMLHRRKPETALANVGDLGRLQISGVPHRKLQVPLEPPPRFDEESMSGTLAG